MARIFFLNRKSAKSYFCSLKRKSGLSWKLLSSSLGVSSRQFNDWRICKNSFPQSVADLVKIRYRVKLPLKVLTKEDNWHLKDAAKKGGQRRFEMYGNLGTLEGRRKGGIKSLKTHKIRNTGFILAKEIRKPRPKGRPA